MRYALAAALCVVALALPGQAQSASDLAGIYSCEGLSPDGQKYSCAVEIVTQDDVFFLAWRFAQGDGRGIGLRQGNVLSVIFQLNDGSIGLTSYQIRGAESSLELSGTWTMPGMNAVSSETLRKTKATSLDDVPLEERRGV